MEGFSGVLDRSMMERLLYEMPMDAIRPRSQTMVPVGTQYELPLDRRWVPHGFKTTDDWYEWTAG